MKVVQETGQMSARLAGVQQVLAETFSSVRQLLSEDVWLKPPQREHIRSDRRGGAQAPKTTLGIMLEDAQIVAVLPGGPAFLGGLQRSDTIIAVDGRSVTVREIQPAILAQDLPDTKVVLTVEGPAGGERNVTCYRAAAERMDKVTRCFQLIANLQQKGLDMEHDYVADETKLIAESLEKVLSESYRSEEIVRSRYLGLMSKIETAISRAQDLTTPLLLPTYQGCGEPKDPPPPAAATAGPPAPDRPPPPHPPTRARRRRRRRGGGYPSHAAQGLTKPRASGGTEE